MIPDQRRADAGDRHQPRAARLLPGHPRGDRRGQRPVRRRHVLLQRRPADDRVAARPSPTSSRSASRPARSCGASRSPGSAPTTWRSRRTASEVVVSASTGNVVHVLRVSDGKELGQFPSGGSPHENVYIDGGEQDHPRQHRHGLHAARPAAARPRQGRAGAARSSTPTPSRCCAATTCARRSTSAGCEDFSTAVRPMTLSPNEQKVYFQLSLLPRLPRDGPAHRQDHRGSSGCPTWSRTCPREQYLLDSAHHGIAMNPRGTKICVAGTMSDYATVVDARHLQARPAAEEGGRQALLGDAELGRRLLLHLVERHRPDLQDLLPHRPDRRHASKVGDHPQRVRNAFVEQSLIDGLPEG